MNLGSIQSGINQVEDKIHKVKHGRVTLLLKLKAGFRSQEWKQNLRGREASIIKWRIVQGNFLNRCCLLGINVEYG